MKFWFVFCAFFVSSFAFAADAPPSSNLDIAGNYTCTGYDSFYDEEYSGPLVIKKVGDSYQFNWNFGEAGGRFSGTAIYNEKKDMIAVVFSNPADPNEKGISLYKINQNGSLSGNWMYQFRDQISDERCTRND